MREQVVDRRFRAIFLRFQNKLPEDDGLNSFQLVNCSRGLIKKAIPQQKQTRLELYLFSEQNRTYQLHKLSRKPFGAVYYVEPSRPLETPTAAAHSRIFERPWRLLLS
jgi:hypothetical protein